MDEPTTPAPSSFSLPAIVTFADRQAARVPWWGWFVAGALVADWYTRRKTKKAE